jgi:phosphohistidine phosphatase
MGDTHHLYLLRHAKSSWDDPRLDDHDRPLAPRGRKAAKRIRAHLRDERIDISLVLCSSARRAQSTLELVAPGGEVHVESGLYGASAEQLLQRLRRVPDGVDSVMLIGHNPGMEDLAIALAGRDTNLAARTFPTAALASMTFTGPWGTLAPERAELTTFVTPRELG